MAKHCETCNLPIPAGQDFCPHCAHLNVAEVADLWAEEAVPSDENDAIGGPHAHTAQGDDSSVNLGSRQPHPDGMPTDLKLVEEAMDSGVSEWRVPSTARGAHGRAETIGEQVFEVEEIPETETSAVDLGSSAVIEIPNEVIEAAEAEERAAERQARQVAGEPEPPFEFTEAEVEALQEEEAVDLGDVAGTARIASGALPTDGSCAPARLRRGRDRRGGGTRSTGQTACAGTARPNRVPAVAGSSEPQWAC